MDETRPEAAGAAGRLEKARRRGRTIVAIRSVIAVLLVVLAIANFADGRVFFGVLLGCLAAANIALTVTRVRRRKMFAARFAARGQSAGA